jgi:hypothetical protein
VFGCLGVCLNLCGACVFVLACVCSAGLSVWVFVLAW